MIEVTIEDNFTPILNNLRENILSSMRQTLIDVAHLVENNTQDLVPFRTGALEHSFKWNVYNSADWVEVEMGYSSIAPDNYDYAFAQHEVNYNHLIKGQWHYLDEGLTASEEGIFKEIKQDYLSLFGT